MIQQAAPIIATALIHSLFAGILCYVAIQVLLLLFKKLKSFYKYHIVNMGLLVTFIVFLLPLKDIKLTQKPVPNNPATVQAAIGNIEQVPVAATAAEVKTSGMDMLYMLDSYIMQYSNVIMMLYLIGLFLFSVRLLLQYVNLVRLKTRGVVPANDEWEQLMLCVQGRLHIKGNIRLAFTDKKISPCIIGHAKAMILIPVSIINNLTTEQAEAILLHELAHYKQYDHYINIVHQCIKCILFFNPFVWMLSKMADKYRELSCDETATEHERNIELAETLAIIAGMHTHHNTLTLNLKKTSTLLTRIQALLQMPEQTKTTNRTSVFTTMTVVLTVGLLVFSNTQLFSSDKDNLSEQLKEISATMYKAGNHKYIVVDALLDSLITLPAKPDVLYMGNGVLQINGAQIPTKIIGRYADKLDRFLTKAGEDEGALFSYEYTSKNPLIIDDILNPFSSFRQITNKDKYEVGIRTFAWKKVFKELYKDGLIKKTNNTFSLGYGPRGIVINHRKLEGTLASKYKKMFRNEVGMNIEIVSGSLTLLDFEKYFNPIEPTGKLNKEEDEWKGISQKLFNNADIDYIIVDAVKDGFLEDGEEFTITFTDSTIVFKGEHIVQELKSEYNDKYRTFVGYYDNRHCYGSITKTVSYADIKDPNSYFRNDWFLFKERAEAQSKFMNKVYQELQKDKLIDTNYRVNIWYKEANDISVNFEQLTGEQLKKYNDLYRQNMPKVVDGSHKNFSTEWNSDKPFLPKGNRKRKAVEKLNYRGIHYTGTPYIKIKGDTADVSSIGAMTYYNHENSKKMKANMKKIVGSMHDDKLFDSNSYYKIEYQYDGVYVNAKQLTGIMGNRYIAMLNSFGYKPGKGHILERHPEGVAIEDTKIGKYVVHMNTHGNNLPAIADKMFTEGNINFILAHALHDGVIKPRKHYSIMYDHGVMTSDGKVMPEPYQSKYSKLMQDFFKAHKQTTYNYSTRGGGVTKKDFNDLDSKLRKNRVVDVRYVNGTYYVDHVIDLLAKDELIDTNAAYEMKYNWDGLKVNGNKLTETKANKYTSILQRGLGHEPKFPDDAISVTNEP